MSNADEMDMTAEEWEASRGERTPVDVEFSEFMAPRICDFDRATDQAARDSYTEQVRRFLASPIGPQLPDGAPLVVLLEYDCIGAWFDEIEAAGQAVIVTPRFKLQDDGEPGEVDWEVPLVLTLTHNDVPVRERLESDDLEWCDVPGSKTGKEIALAAEDRCDYFWWSGKEHLEGWDVRVVWPLGYAKHDDVDLARVGRGLSGADHQEMLQRIARDQDKVILHGLTDPGTSETASDPAT